MSNNQRATNRNIFGVLNGERLEKLCEHFKIDKSELDVSFEGWAKVALMTKDRIFLFPRTPDDVKGLEFEVLSLFNSDEQALYRSKFIEAGKITGEVK